MRQTDISWSIRKWYLSYTSRWTTDAQARLLICAVSPEPSLFAYTIHEPCHVKTCFCHMRTTKAQIQRRRSAWASVQSDQCLCCSLPRWYNISSLVSIVAISWLSLASIREQAGLSLTWSQTRKTGFLVTRLIWNQRKHQTKNHTSGPILFSAGAFEGLQVAQPYSLFPHNSAQMAYITSHLSSVKTNHQHSFLINLFGVCDLVRLKLACSAIETS